MIEDDDLVATLMRTAGRRAAPPDVLREHAFAAARAVLERKLQSRRRRRTALRLAAAVLLTVGVAGLVVELTQRPAATGTVARVDRVIGVAQTRSNAAGDARPLDAGASLAPGARIATGAGSRIGLLLGDGTSLRLAAGTVVELLSAHEIRLDTGRIYVDTDAQPDGTAALRVHTEFGVTRDLGTRFEIQCDDGGYRLRVRDGLVVLDRGTAELHGAAGEELTLDAAGDVGRATIAPHSPEWQWVMDVAPQPDLDGASLSEFLDWVGRETGRPVRYSTPEVGDRVRITVLHGHIEGLEPLDALAVMLATTDFEHVLEDDGTILIRPRKTAPRRP